MAEVKGGVALFRLPTVGLCVLPVSAARRGSRGVRPVRSSESGALLADTLSARGEEDRMAQVMIGVDPRKRFATIKITNDRGQVVGGGWFSTTRSTRPWTYPSRASLYLPTMKCRSGAVSVTSLPSEGRLTALIFRAQR